MDNWIKHIYKLVLRKRKDNLRRSRAFRVGFISVSRIFLGPKISAKYGMFMSINMDKIYFYFF